jgi:hypothetical protein
VLTANDLPDTNTTNATHHSTNQRQTMKITIDLTADIIDVRDIIERFEELEQLTEGQEEEFGALMSLLDNLENNGGDEQWRGDWYPITLIRESHFTDYTREMLEDCGTIPRDLPAWVHIDWEATAREVKMD